MLNSVFYQRIVEGGISNIKVLCYVWNFENILKYTCTCRKRFMMMHANMQQLLKFNISNFLIHFLHSQQMLICFAMLLRYNTLPHLAVMSMCELLTGLGG